jgi:cellulose synthase/poly-beta-1,6-N-acetylglucosamine synthase-like glycosyltransferase
MAAVAIVLLIVAYGIGAVVLVVRTVLVNTRRRRLRYRSHRDDVLATSRFTIPVSLILTLDDSSADLPGAINRLLSLRYPELELIVVVSGATDPLDTLKLACELMPCELFFRRTLQTRSVRAIFRSATEPRLLVVDKLPGGEGDALNCGVNLARYRYVCAVDPEVTYHPDSLLEAMQVALEDPAVVVGVTSLAITPVQTADDTAGGPASAGFATALLYLARARTRLLTIARRRLDLPPTGHPGFTIWRRDAVVEVGGFVPDGAAPHGEMIFRMHQHFRTDRKRYRIVHVSEPVGVLEPAATRGGQIASNGVPVSVLWRHREMLFNTGYGRLGVWDFPRFLFTSIAAPWLEFGAFALLIAAVPLGVLSIGKLLLLLALIALGSGIVANCALLLVADPKRDARPAALFKLILAGPFEYFLGRPAMLMAKLTRQAR